MTTRKRKHFEATMVLEQAAMLLDQAHAMLKDARTTEAVVTECPRGARRWVNGLDAYDVLKGLVSAARDTRCDTCDLLLVNCQCQWSNEEVK